MFSFPAKAQSHIFRFVQLEQRFPKRLRSRDGVVSNGTRPKSRNEAALLNFSGLCGLGSDRPYDITQSHFIPIFYCVVKGRATLKRSKLSTTTRIHFCKYRFVGLSLLVIPVEIEERYSVTFFA